jgi:hypothetical protein
MIVTQHLNNEEKIYLFIENETSVKLASSYKNN